MEKLKHRLFSKQNRSNLNNNLALLFSFSLPLNQVISTGFLVLWIVVALMDNHIWTLKGKKVIQLLPVILFLCYGASIFFSVNQDFSILGRKLSLFALPIVFFNSKNNPDYINKLLIGFVYGLLSACFFCLLRAVYCSVIFDGGQILFKANVEKGKGFIESILFGGNHFFGKYLSYFHQTVYFSMYLCTGIAILLKRPNLFRPNFKVVLVVLFVIMIFLLSNKAGIITLFVVLLLYFLTLRIKLYKKVFMVFLVLLGSLFFIKTNPRFNLDLTKIMDGQLVINKDARYGFATRILSWDASIELIKKSSFWGYGAGDTQSALNKVYQEKSYFHPLKEQYNSHNQFLQIWLENGLFGFVVFIFILGIMVSRALFKNQDSFLFLSIALILIINALFESYLNRYSGISFFAFFWCMAIKSSITENES